MSALGEPPLLSTPATHIFGINEVPTINQPSTPLDAEELCVRYEIQRTIDEIRRRRWKRIALQFPDDMLADAPTIVDTLARALQEPRSKTDATIDQPVADLTIPSRESDPVRFYVLGDTSYGACCVDEVAAEHVDADSVVHYGRTCLSPTVRLPVLYVFTHKPLSIANVVEDFKIKYPDQNQKVILMADVAYSSHLASIDERLRSEGYAAIYRTEIIHDPSSPIPNRTIPQNVLTNPKDLRDWQLFHISDPPKSLLLTLFSRVADIYIHRVAGSQTGTGHDTLSTSSTLALRRRYAVITSVSSVSIIGILVNTLSVRNYLHIVELVKSRIAEAGKRSYTFVVGKVNAAKVANFSEIGAWVVVGCWESSLIDGKEFWKPMLTPFELDFSLQKDNERVWTGEWRSDFQNLLDQSRKYSSIVEKEARRNLTFDSLEDDNMESSELGSEEESSPPEFDLRTGRYVSRAKLVKSSVTPSKKEATGTSQGISSGPLIKRANGGLALIGGEISPGAEYLQSKRTWKGLGSDFEVSDDKPEKTVTIEEGRSGIARGYTHAHQPNRH
ncbi:MAG: hypothetical protein LQ342_007310 [Letrouitia transgressa]|nr:MAG: hypothetical protein LQ342_007310 [Letrouitia transgressa]